MSRRRFLLCVPLSAIVAAVAILSLSGPAATGRGSGPPKWWKPPHDVRKQLAEVSTDRLRAYDHALVGFGTRHTLSTQDDPNRGIGAARDWIKARFDEFAATSHGAMTTSEDSFIQPVSPRVPVPTRLTNVIATLQGSDTSPDHPVYVVGAHYDSRRTDVLDATGDAPGANDDASGVSAVLELARVMARHPSEGTIVFVAYAGEEQGLYGSDHLARVAKAEGWNVQGVLNMDIIGSSLGGNGIRDRRTIRLFSEGIPTAETDQQKALRQTVGGENDGVSRQLARYVKETGENKATDMGVKLVWRRDRFLRSGDQVSWLLQGWPGVRFTEPNENFDHEHQDVRVEDGVQFGDLEQFVDFRYLTRVTRVVGSSLAALARSPRAPRDSRVIASALGYDSELRWTADPEPDVVGYEIVWRDSLEPLWTHVRDVGNVTDATIKNLNKDDVQLGVRAIDRDGNRSPVAFAVAAAQ